MNSEPKLTPSSPVSEAVAACRGALVTTAVFSFFVNLLMLTGPLFMLQVYDRVLTSRSVPTLVALMVLVVGLYLVMGLLEVARARVLARISGRVDAQLGPRVFEAVVDHGVRDSRVGTQPARDLDTVRQFVAGPGPFAFFDSPWVPIFVGVIFLLHWSLGVFAIAGAFVLAALAALNEAGHR